MLSNEAVELAHNKCQRVVESACISMSDVVFSREELAQFLIEPFQTRAQRLASLDGFRNRRLMDSLGFRKSRLTDSLDFCKSRVADSLGFCPAKSPDRAFRPIGQADSQLGPP